MSRSRNRLAVSKLEHFAAWCEKQGWKRHQCKGAYEVLRMRHEVENDTLIVYKRDASNSGGELVHLTLFGIAERTFTRYMRDKRNADHSAAN